MSLIVRILLTPVWILGLIAFGSLTYQLLQFVLENHQLYLPFLYGMGGGFVVFYLLLFNKSTNLLWFQTLTHELTHALFNILFLNKMAYLFASAGKGGEVASRGSHNFIILLTPYCFPIITFFLVLVRPFLQASSLHTFDIIFGVTYMYHLLTFLQQATPFQTDITKCGLLFSYTFIVFMNVFIAGALICFLSGDFPAVWDYCKTGALLIRDYVSNPAFLSDLVF